MGESVFARALRLAAEIRGRTTRDGRGNPVDATSQAAPVEPPAPPAVGPTDAERDAAIRAAGLRETDGEDTQVERFHGAIILHEVPPEHRERLEAVGFVTIRGGERRMIWEAP